MRALVDAPARRVEGRATDTLRDGAGRPSVAFSFSCCFSALAHKVRGFQVVQRKDRSIDLKLVPGSEFDVHCSTW